MVLRFPYESCSSLIFHRIVRSTIFVEEESGCMARFQFFYHIRFLTIICIADSPCSMYLFINMVGEDVGKSFNLAAMVGVLDHA